MTIQTRPVTKQWLDGLLRPCSGEVVFELAYPLEDVGTAAYMPTPVKVPVVDGQMTWNALIGDFDPAGTIYKVTPCLLDQDGCPLRWNGRPLPPYHVIIPFGDTEMELPPATYQTDRFVGVVGPAGSGVMFLEIGEEVPPGHPEKLLIARPAS